MGTVQALLEGLAERGEYIHFGGQKSGARVPLVHEYTVEETKRIQDYYGQCRRLRINFANEELDYEELGGRLRRIAKTPRGAFVDVTVVKKRYLGDIIAVSLVEGIKGLFVFGLKGARPDFERPWCMLIHHLEKQTPTSYEYVNVLDTAIYQVCARMVVIRAPRLTIASAATILFLVLALLIYITFGSDSSLLQVLFLVAAVASIFSLIFLFITPRGI